MILDGVVRPAGKDLGDLGPLVAVHAVGVHEDVLLRFRPRVLLDGWVQLIVPSARGKRTRRRTRKGNDVRYVSVANDTDSLGTCLRQLHPRVYSSATHINDSICHSESPKLRRDRCCESNRTHTETENNTIPEIEAGKACVLVRPFRTTSFLGTVLCPPSFPPLESVTSAYDAKACLQSPPNVPPFFWDI